MKKILSSVLLGTILATGAIVPTNLPHIAPMSAEAAQKEVSVYVDGKKLSFTDAKPYVDKNYRTMMPLRAISEAFGCEVKWEDPNVRIIDGKSTYVFTVDSSYYTVNGAKKKMDTVTVKKGYRTYVPLRFVGELFGEVKWNEKDYRVDINTKGGSIKPPTDSTLVDGQVIPADKVLGIFGKNTNPSVNERLSNSKWTKIKWLDKSPYEVKIENDRVIFNTKAHGTMYVGTGDTLVGYSIRDNKVTMGTTMKASNYWILIDESNPGDGIKRNYIAFPNPIK